MRVCIAGSSPGSSCAETPTTHGAWLHGLKSMHSGLCTAVDVRHDEARRVGARQRDHLHRTRGGLDGGRVQHGASIALVEHEALHLRKVPARKELVLHLRKRPADRVGSRCVPRVPHHVIGATEQGAIQLRIG